MDNPRDLVCERGCGATSGSQPCLTADEYHVWVEPPMLQICTCKLHPFPHRHYPSVTVRPLNPLTNSKNKEGNINPGDKVKWSASGSLAVGNREGILMAKFYKGETEWAVVQWPTGPQDNFLVMKAAKLQVVKPCPAVKTLGNVTLNCTRVTTHSEHGIHETWYSGALISWGVNERGLPACST